MLDKTVMIGVIGATEKKHIHTDYFCQIEGVSISAKTSSSLIDHHETIPKVYSSVKDLLDDPEIDAVILTVPNKWHKSLAIQALHSGKHVILDQPLGIDSTSAKEIYKAHEKTGKMVFVFRPMRWKWQIQQLKKYIESGEFGHIYHVKTGMFKRNGIPNWGSWKTRLSESGGGSLMDIGGELLDLCLYLLEDCNPCSVFGSTYGELGRQKIGIDPNSRPNGQGYFDVDDLATALIKLDNGSSISLDVTWSAHIEPTIRPFLSILGTEGGAYVHEDGIKLFTEKFNEPIDIEIKSPSEESDECLLESRHIIECIQTGNIAKSSLVSSVTSCLIIDAIYKSSSHGREVVLNCSL
ncbi:Gfo/Idh/MocA family protein [Litchfieldia alkalitelluris]|uniref:Gfo/Idh/MocA family protein n=1 Tax=Litchfieldia alkalitelluris TaxID=304268 RepID=UPI000997A00F|nr:Gfo/Idh/MocA family oxidoreductase [Litchfieldia alkalitelluris]